MEEEKEEKNEKAKLLNENVDGTMKRVEKEIVI